jgi:hypothetical protein
MRSTLCFQLKGGEWKIVHSHMSLPFYPGPEMKGGGLGVLEPQRYV